MNRARQLCTFFIDDLYCGIDVVHVQEVIRAQEMTVVPLAPEHVRGLINLRGQIVMAIEMRTRLGLSKRRDDARSTNVVVRTEGGGVCLLVDDIDDVVEVFEEAFEPPPGTVSATGRDLFRGVHKLERRLLLELDAGRVVEIAA